MYKTHHVRTTFGSCDVEKVHAVVARSKFPSQNAQNTPGSDHFWKLRWWKSARRCGAKHISKSKCTKHTTFGPLLEVVMSKKCTPLWREAQFEVRSEKKTDGFGALLDVQMSFYVAGARDYAPCQKWAKREGFAAFPKTMAGVGHMQRIWQDVFRVAGAVQETCSSELFGSQGADFLRGVAFWSIRSSVFGKMILHDRCSTSYDLASLFRGRRHTLDRWSGKIARRIGTRQSALHSTFDFWRTSRRIASFLMLLSSKAEDGEVSQIVSFLMLSSSKIEEVSQNSFVFKLADGQIDR